MKKIILASFVGLISFNSIAQDPLKELECKGYVDAIEKGIKNTNNPKQAVKSATWVKLAETYQDLASRCGSDSMAAQKAYDTYLKALEVENTAGGKKAKAIEDALANVSLGNAFLQQGAAFYNSKNMEMASKFFNQSSKINSKDTTAALYAGIVAQGLGDNTGAIESFNKFFANGGKDPAVFYSLAQIYKIQKNFPGAIEILKKGAQVHPADKDLKNEIINTYITSNQIGSAIEDLEKMVAAEPNNALNLTNLGLLYDSKAQDANIEVQKIKDQLGKSNTEDLEKKLAIEKDKLPIYEGEIATLTAKLKKDPKTAAATKKRITEVTSTKTEIEQGIVGLTNQIAEKKGNKANDELAAKLPSLQASFQEYKVKAFEIYKKTLALDANNYDANFNMAVMYFNEAVETKKLVDAMDMKAYQASGKDIEMKACGQFNTAKPYFDKCKSLKPDDDLVIENLKNLDRILGQCKN
jgi:tetratricopeptide (TPR) repeat protein